MAQLIGFDWSKQGKDVGVLHYMPRKNLMAFIFIFLQTFFAPNMFIFIPYHEISEIILYYQIKLWTCMVLFLSIHTLFALRRQALSIYYSTPVCNLQLPYDKLTHCITILIYREPDCLIFDLLDSLTDDTRAHQRVLLLAMEEGTPDQQILAEKVERLYGSHFRKVLYCVHPRLDFHQGTAASNHCHAQIAATHYLEAAGIDLRNVLWSKFDANVICEPGLLNEIEDHFVRLSAEERLKYQFVSTVIWNNTEEELNAMGPLEYYYRLFFSYFRANIANGNPMHQTLSSGSLYTLKHMGFVNPHVSIDDWSFMFTIQCSSENTRIVYLNHLLMKRFPVKNVYDKIREQHIRWGYSLMDACFFTMDVLFGNVTMNAKSRFYVALELCRILPLSLCSMNSGPLVMFSFYLLLVHYNRLIRFHFVLAAIGCTTQYIIVILCAWRQIAVFWRRSPSFPEMCFPFLLAVIATPVHMVSIWLDMCSACPGLLRGSLKSQLICSGS